MNIRTATIADAQQICEIYNRYIRDTIITFETEPLTATEIAQRIEINLTKYHWLVAEIDQQLIGYAYYGQFRTRAAYNHTVESAIYLLPAAAGKGYGQQLYRNLIAAAKTQGYREMMGVIALPNEASIALHRKLSFVEVGLLKNVGYKFNQYIDVGIWQLSLFNVDEK